VGSRVGDWEADLVLGKQGTGTIGTPADRKSHIYLTIKTQPKWPRPLSQCWVVTRTAALPSRSTTAGRLPGTRRSLPHWKRKPTWLTCLPSWERGLNENTHGLLRQCIPKGTDLAAVTGDEPHREHGVLNSRPRKYRGFRQPSVVFASLRQEA